MWAGFWRLSNARPVGVDGTGRLLLTEVAAYANLHNFDYAKRLEFLGYVERMDGVFMDHIAKLREAEEQKRNNKSNERRPRRR